MDIEISMKRTMDDLFSDMMTTVGQEITQFELRLRELIRSNPQLAQQFIPPGGMPQNGMGPDAFSAFQNNKGRRSLPWFKNGLRGAFRKLWYGDNSDNPDWTKGVGRRFGESVDSGILTLNEYNELSDDVETILEGLFTEFTILSPGGELDKLFQLFRKNLFKHAKNYIGQAKRMILQTVERERGSASQSSSASNQPSSSPTLEPKSAAEPDLPSFEPETDADSKGSSFNEPKAASIVAAKKEKEVDPLKPQTAETEPGGFSLTDKQEKAIQTNMKALVNALKDDMSGFVTSAVRRKAAAKVMQDAGLDPHNPDHVYAVFKQWNIPKQKLLKRRPAGSGAGSGSTDGSGKKKRGASKYKKGEWGPMRLKDDEGNWVDVVPDEELSKQSFYDPSVFRRPKKSELNLNFPDPRPEELQQQQSQEKESSKDDE